MLEVTFGSRVGKGTSFFKIGPRVEVPLKGILISVELGLSVLASLGVIVPMVRSFGFELGVSTGLHCLTLGFTSSDDGLLFGSLDEGFFDSTWFRPTECTMAIQPRSTNTIYIRYIFSTISQNGLQVY